jgi:hypothetical protein
MKRILTALIPLLLFNSCITQEKKVTIDEILIFGYSGFCLKDSLNNVYTPSEIWLHDSIKLKFDSTRLDIRQYFDFKIDSFVRIATRFPTKQIEYFSVLPSDTIGLKKLINNLLIDKRFQTNYDFPDSIIVVYDGWRYKLYCKTSDKKELSINYIPECLPDSLKILHKFVQNIVMKSDLIKINEFQFNPLTIKEALRLYAIYPPPAIPYKTEDKAFYIPPK